MRNFRETPFFLLIIVLAESSIFYRNYCYTDNPGLLLSQFDDCLVNKTIRTKWLQCQIEVLGSSEPNMRAERFCAKNETEKSVVEKKTTKCVHAKLREKIGKRIVVGSHRMFDEWDANCGFCKNKESFATMLDDCLTDGRLKDALINCRIKNFKTKDPKKAADIFCKQSQHKKAYHMFMTISCLKDFHKVWVGNYAEATKDCDFNRIYQLVHVQSIAF